MIRRRPKNEKTILKGLETVRCCFKTRYFYADSCFLILKFRFSLGEILPRRTNVRLPVRYSPTLHPPERPKGTFLWALIRRGPKNEKSVLKRVLKQFVAVLRPVTFMQTVVFLILKFRFSLGEILPRRTNVRLPVRYSPTLHPSERPKGTFLLALIRRRPKNEKELKQGLKAILSCFKTRCFYMSDCFFYFNISFFSRRNCLGFIRKIYLIEKGLNGFFPVKTF